MREDGKEGGTGGERARSTPQTSPPGGLAKLSLGCGGFGRDRWVEREPQSTLSGYRSLSARLFHVLDSASAMEGPGHTFQDSSSDSDFQARFVT